MKKMENHQDEVREKAERKKARKGSTRRKYRIEDQVLRSLRTNTLEEQEEL